MDPNKEKQLRQDLEDLEEQRYALQKECEAIEIRELEIASALGEPDSVDDKAIRTLMEMNPEVLAGLLLQSRELQEAIDLRKTLESVRKEKNKKEKEIERLGRRIDKLLDQLPRNEWFENIDDDFFNEYENKNSPCNIHFVDIEKMLKELNNKKKKGDYL